MPTTPPTITTTFIAIPSPLAAILPGYSTSSTGGELCANSSPLQRCSLVHYLLASTGFSVSNKPIQELRQDDSAPNGIRVITLSADCSELLATTLQELGFGPVYVSAVTTVIGQGMEMSYLKAGNTLSPNNLIGSRVDASGKFITKRVTPASEYNLSVSTH